MKSGDRGPHDWISALLSTVISVAVLSTLGGHGENVAICKAGTGHLPGNEVAATRTLDFPVSRTARNKFLLFTPPSQRQFVIAA